ncbi:MAG: prealbumin-like fold domain-containing protein, partial [Anaerovoracaceae bacterium]
KKIIFNTYKFAVTEQTDHKDGEDYKIFYVNIDMANNPVKGKIEITKMGESLAGWLNGNNGATAVWDNAKLKDATFKVYAAEDIRQVDGVTRIKAFDSKDNKEIALEEVTRDHAQVTLAKSFWQSLIKTGEKILRFIGLDISLGNKAETEYIATETKGASYTETFSKKEGNLTYTYTVDYSLEYAKGGFNYTNIHVTKNTVADDYVANIDTTKPVLVCGNEEIDINNVNLYNKNMVKLNGEITDEYGKTDVTAKVISKTVKVIPVDGAVAPEAPEGFIIDDTNKKMYLASKTVNQGKEDETKTYQVYVNENGTNRWVDCDANGNFSDEPAPQEGYTMIDRADKYMASSADGKYQIYVTDGGTKKWIDCDANGNFYKSYNQNYNFTTVQHFNTAEGFSFKFDELALASQTDNAKEIATTVVTGFKGITPAIGINGAYTSTTEGDITTFVATPDTIAPVYFMTADGIKSSMILTGGIGITTIELTQSQLAKYKSEYPVIEYKGNLIDWGKDLNPDNNYFEYVIDDSNYCKAERHEKSPTVKEVYYTLTIATNSKDAKTGFKVTYPDTTQLIPTLGTDEGKEVGKLLFASTEATMVYPIGNPVATITTNEKGIATTPNLPLGKYYIHEESSAIGHVNSGQWKEFNLKYKDQYTPLIWDKATFDNEAVSVKIDLTKLYETGYMTKAYEPGSGAVFGVYSAEKITANTTTDKRIDKKTIKADTLVGIITTRNDGTGTTVAKLPLGRYYVKEISAPSGYKLNGTKYYFDAVDLLTADVTEFAYDDIGVSGKVVQDGNNNTVISLESLYSKPMNNIKVDGKDYDLLQSVTDGNVTTKKLDGRTKTKVTVASGKTSTITFANGSTLTVVAEKNTYKAIFDGAKTVTYAPKATKTNFLGEVTYDYVAPKADTELTDADKAKITSLELTSPEGTSKVNADVTYSYGSAKLTWTGTVTSITKDGKAIDNVDKLTELNLDRIVTTTTGEGEDAKTETKINATKATINFADGVTYEISFDKTGNFVMSDSGIVDKDLETESKLVTNGDTAIAGPINFKNTTAKTYARNNTDAGVLNITMGAIKNDRLPATPTVPNVPVTPDTPKGTLEISKVDVETGETLAGAIFEILDKDKNLIFTGSTDDGGKLSVGNIPLGIYYYHETKAPIGYLLNDKLYKFQLKENGEVVKATMVNGKEPLVPEKPDKPKKSIPQFKPQYIRPEIPQTGDSSNLLGYLILLIIAGSGLLAGVKVKKERK